MNFSRLTKAVLAVTVCFLILASATVSVFAQGVVIKGEPDGQNKTVLMDEHFYSGSLEPNFTSDNVEVTTDSYGMHFEGAYHFGSALVLTAYKLKDYNRFTFSIDMLGTNEGFIYCGFGGADEKATVSYYDFNLCVSKGVTALYEMGGMSTWTNVGTNLALNNALVVGKTTDFAVTLEKVSGNDFKVKFEILEEGKPIISTTYGDAVIRMQNSKGYFCMWGGMNEKFEIRNFKVYDSPTNLAFSDDFSNSSLTYGDEAVGNSNWHINEARFTRDEIFISRNAGPIFNKAGDTITAKTPLELCNDVSKPYEISYNARIQSIAEKSTFGLFLGAKKDVDLDKATIIGVSAYDDKFASLDLIRNGKIVNAGQNLVPLSALNIDDVAVEIKLTMYSDYSLGVNVGGIQFNFGNIKYDGYWGICNYSLDDKSAADVRLDAVKVIKNTYTPCASPDLSNDFAGIKLTQDGFEEYYISDRTYYIGPGVSIRPKSAFTIDPAISFENSGSYSAFAPKQKYTDFILQFDLKMVSEGKNSQWFGVNFGKKSFAAISDTTSSVNFEYSAWGTDPYTQITANLCTFDDGSKIKKIDDYHFYKDQETKYNFMFVAKNRTVYVYFKEDSEDISKLGICRAVIPDINTDGYVSIFGVSGLSFDILNYKLTNISDEATGDSDIALRENFDGKKISDKLVTEGTAKVKDGAMQLSGGSVGMKDNSTYYIANFTTLNMNADATVSFSDNKSFVISKDLKKITVNDGSKKQVFDVSKYNLAEYKNVQFQMILQYDALSLSAKGIYEPSDKFASPILEYTFAKPVAEGILKWTSQDALIDDISVYALDHTYKASNVSYEEDPNDSDFWISKLTDKQASANGKANGGISTLFIVIYAVIGVIILALAGVIIALLLKKRGKAQ